MSHATGAETATEAIRAALHEPFGDLTAPDLAHILGEAKALYWLLPDLLDRLADQLVDRSLAGGLRDDRGPGTDPTLTAAEGGALLRDAASTIRSAGSALEAAHNSLDHLGELADGR